MNNINKINKNKTISTKITLFSLLVAFVLVMSGPATGSISSSYVYAAKPGGGSSGGSGGDSTHGSDGGGAGSKGGSSTGISGDSGGHGIDKGGFTGGGDRFDKKRFGFDGGGGNDKFIDGRDKGGRFEGPLPGIGPGLGDGKQHDNDKKGDCLGGSCHVKEGPFFPHKPFPFRHFHDRDNNNNDIHKTVIVHKTVKVNDGDTIISFQQNPIVGTCFVTQTQVVSIPGLVAQLLDQCTSVTIIRG